MAGLEETIITALDLSPPPVLSSEDMDAMVEELSTGIEGKQQAVVPTIPAPKIKANPVTTAAASINPGLHAIQSAMDVEGAKASSLISVIQANAEQDKGLTDVMVKAIEDAGESSKLIEEQKLVAALETQDSIIAVTQELVSPEAQAKMLTRLQEDSELLNTKLEEQAEEREGDNFFMSAIKAGLNMELYGTPGGRRELEVQNARAQKQASLETIQGATAAVESIAQAEKLTQRTLTKAVIEENSRLIDAQTTLKAAEARRAGLQNNSSAIGDILKANTAGVRNMISLHQLRNSEEQTALRRETIAMQRAELEQRARFNEINLALKKIELGRETLGLGLDEALQSTKITAAKQQIAQGQITLESTSQKLKEQVDTYDTRTALLNSQAATAAVNLEQAQASLDTYKGTDEARREKLQLELDNARLTNTGLTAQIEQNALLAPLNLRRAEIANLLGDINLLSGEAEADIATTTKLDRIAQIQATAETAVGANVVRKGFEQTAVDAVQDAQAVLYGEDKIDEPSVIIHNLTGTGVAPEVRKKYATLFEMGSLQDLDGKMMIGETPYDAAVNLGDASLTGNLSNTKSVQMIQQIQQEQETKYAEDPAGAPSPNDRGTIKADFNTTAKDWSKTNHKLIKKDDASNPFYAQPLTILAKHSTDLAADPFYTKVLAVSGLKESDPEKVIQLAFAGIKAKTITTEEAIEGISKVYNTAMLYNNEMQGGFTRIGLPNQTAYNASMPKPMGFFTELLSDAVQSVKRNPGKTGILVAGATFAAIPVTAPLTVAAAAATAVAGTQFVTPTIPTAEKINLADVIAVRDYVIRTLSSNSPLNSEE